MVPQFENPEATLVLTSILLLAVVQWIKTRLKKDGPVVEGIGGVLGLLAGAGWYISAFDVPDNASAWFALILAAVMLGLVPSGLYKVGMAGADRVGQAIAEATNGND